MSQRSAIFGIKVCSLAILALNAYGISIDCPSLVIFAQGLGIQNKKPVTWTSLQGDCCTASGVRCVNQRVTEIIWVNFGLDGFMNETALPSGLTYLELSRNLLTGSIPLLPSGISVLLLSGNRLTGSIPDLPSGMTVLYLSNNQLAGGIPALPSGMTKLYLNTNQLNGSIPALPIGLTQLYLSNNQFTGTLKLNQPTRLFINDNVITDVVIADNSQLVLCDLSNNPLLRNPNIANLNMCTMTGLYSLSNTMITLSAKTTLYPLPNTVKSQVSGTYLKIFLNSLSNTMITPNAMTSKITETITVIKWSTETELVNQTALPIRFYFVPTLFNWILMGLRILISFGVLVVIIIKTPWAREWRNKKKLRN